MKKNTKNPQVLVCQHGARHRYAVPRMLDQAGMLTALYTDSSAQSTLGKWASKLGDRAPESLQRLARREIHGIDCRKIFSADTGLLRESAQRIVGMQKSGMNLYAQRHRQLSRKMKTWGLSGADVIYSMYHESLDFVRWAKSQGVCSVVDVFISPLTNQIMSDEHDLFPDWGGPQCEEDLRREDRLWRETAELAEILLCPSEWVAHGVRSLIPSAESKIQIVPYGCSIDYQGQVNQPILGRILFAGGDALRKGLHHLAQAATLLRSKEEFLDVRVAGAIPEHIMNHPLCKDLNFLGKLTLDQMHAEYLAADCFVLPSLSEGFAGVVAEAIGAGCPVVVTKESGSSVVDGREGVVVPVRDPQMLAEGIWRIVGDRDFRAHCSEQCLQSAEFYTEAMWKQRLEGVLYGASHD